MTAENYVQILLGIIALVGTVFGAILGYMGKSKKQSIEDARLNQEQKDMYNFIKNEIEEVKKRLDTHNHYAEKMGSIEKTIVIMQADIKYIKDDYEKKFKN